MFERLPCLATAQPAPAATSAAAVEMLKVDGPPPVPAVSTRSSRSARRPMPPGGASSAPGRSARRPSRPSRAAPTRNAAVCDLAGAALHDLVEHGRRVVGGQVRAVADGVDRAGEDLVRHQSPAPRKFASRSLAVGGEDRLGVELDALGRQLAVADRHHDVARASRSPRTRRAGRGRRPASGSGRPAAGSGRPAKMPAPSCSISASLPWIGSPRIDRPPNASTIAWWPRQTPSVGTPASGKARAASIEIPASGGRAGARRDHEPLGAALEQLGDRRRGRCGPRRPPRRARPGTGRGCR